MNDKIELLYMNWWVKDFLSDTTDLDAEESGAYMMLIGHCFLEGSIPREMNKLLRISRLYDQSKTGIIDDLLGRYFHENGLGYVNNRAIKERKEAIDRVRKASEAGRKGAAARWGKPIEPLPAPRTDDDLLNDFGRPPGSTIDALMKHWNTHKELPKARGSSVNIAAPKLSEMIQKVSLFSADEIQKAIDNLAKYWEKIEARFRPGSFDRFVTGSIELWVDDAKPWEKFEDEKKAKKKSKPIEPRWCSKCMRTLEDGETEENCPLCKEIADPNRVDKRLETSRTVASSR